MSSIGTIRLNEDGYITMLGNCCGVSNYGQRLSRKTDTIIFDDAFTTNKERNKRIREEEIEEYKLYESEGNPESFYEDCFTGYNAELFFDPELRKNDLMMFVASDYRINPNLTIPVSLNVMRLLQRNIKETVEFVFNDSAVDTPTQKDNIHIVTLNARNAVEALNAYMHYIAYTMINYLPSADFPFDHMPTIEQVRIDGCPSTFFDDLTDTLNDTVEDVTYIDVYRNGLYKYRYEKDSSISKTMYCKYVRLNPALPIFYVMGIEEAVHLSKLDHMEVTLHWFKKSDRNYMTDVTQSTQDEYLSVEGLRSCLVLDSVFCYLYAYYMGERVETRRNCYLAISVTGYFHHDGGLFGVRTIDYGGRHIFDNIVLNTIRRYEVYEMMSKKSIYE